MGDIVQRMKFEATYYVGVDGHREKDALLQEGASEIARLREALESIATGRKRILGYNIEYAEQAARTALKRKDVS